MKKMILAVAMTIGFGAALAEETKPAEPVHAYLVSVDTSKHGADIKLSPSDYPNGVYVLIKEFSGERPGSEAIFADKLRAHGFKIADKAENADAIFRVGSSSISFKDIDQNTNSVAARKVDGVTGAVISAVATGGISLLTTDLSFLGNKKPVYNNMIVEIVSGSKKEGVKITVMNASIKTDADNAQVTRVSFEIMLDEWLKAHLSNYVASQPASVVAPAQSLADAAKTRE
jgi:hypothetical protein